MAFIFRLTVMSLLITIVCSSGLVNLMDKKINAIRDVMEVEIGLLRHDMGNISSQLAQLLHGKDGFSSKVQNDSQCGCEKAEKGQEASGQFISNHVIRKAFGSEKKLLKTNIEMIHRYVNSTINDVDRMDRSLTSYKVDLSDTKSHVERINDITVNQSREIKEQMDSLMTKLLDIAHQMDKQDKIQETRMTAIENIVHSTLTSFQARVDKLEANLSETRSHVKRINDMTVNQNREILAMKEQMSSFITRTEFVSEKKSMKNEVQMIHRIVNSTIKNVDRIDRSLTSYKVDLDETNSHIKRINDITVNQSRSMKEQMDSVTTKFDSLNETFKRGLEEIRLDISDLPVSKARMREADLNKRLTEYGLKEVSQVGKHGRSIYVHLRSRYTDYNSATRNCSDLGGYMVEISSEEENAFIKQTFIDGYNWFYLGGSDIIKKGDWKWTHSGVRIPMRNQGGFQKWAENEPNNYYSDNCLYMLRNGEWHDHDCQHLMPYVCEVDLI